MPPKGALKIELMLLTLDSFFFILLILYISLDQFLINANRTYKIASSPKMIPPIWFLLHIRITPEQFYGQLPFQCPHQFRNGYPWRNRHNEMDMITLYTHLLYLTFLPLTKQSYILLNQLLNLSFQNAKTIFGYPYNMIITFIYNMRQFLVLTHVTNIGKALRTLPPSKTVGF